MIEDADAAGLARAALALVTVLLARELRREGLAGESLADLVREAHALVGDPAGYVVDRESATAANDFLDIAEALVRELARRRR